MNIHTYIFKLVWWTCAMKPWFYDFPVVHQGYFQNKPISNLASACSYPTESQKLRYCHWLYTFNTRFEMWFVRRPLKMFAFAFSFHPLRGNHKTFQKCVLWWQKWLSLNWSKAISVGTDRNFKTITNLAIYCRWGKQIHGTLVQSPKSVCFVSIS